MISIHTVANCNKRKSSEFRSWKSTFTISDPFSLARYISDFFGEQMGTKACLHRRRERERERRTVPWHCSCVERPCFAAKKEIERRFLCAKCSFVRATTTKIRLREDNDGREKTLQELHPSRTAADSESSHSGPPPRPHQCIFQVESTTNHAPGVWRKRPSITRLRNHRFSHESHSFRDTVQPVTQHMKLTFEKKRNSNFPPAVL